MVRAITNDFVRVSESLSARSCILSNLLTREGSLRVVMHDQTSRECEVNGLRALHVLGGGDGEGWMGGRGKIHVVIVLSRTPSL